MAVTISIPTNTENTMSGRREGHLQSTKAMTLPAGPPTFRREVAAFEIAGPAVAVTLDRPSEALEAADDAVSLALAAASEVAEACLTAVLRVRNCVCRSTARDAVMGIVKTVRKEDGVVERDKQEAPRVAAGRRTGESNGGLVRFVRTN